MDSIYILQAGTGRQLVRRVAVAHSMFEILLGKCQAPTRLLHSQCRQSVGSTTVKQAATRLPPLLLRARSVMAISGFFVGPVDTCTSTPRKVKLPFFPSSDADPRRSQAIALALP